MAPLAPGSICPPPSDVNGFIVSRLRVTRPHLLCDELPNQPLLLRDAAGGVYDLEIELADQVVVLLKDSPLEQSEALDGIRTPAHVHPRLVKLQLHAACEQSVNGHVDRDSEIQGQVRT